jgi:hypothetical protein
MLPVGHFHEEPYACLPDEISQTVLAEVLVNSHVHVQTAALCIGSLGECGLQL